MKDEDSIGILRHLPYKTRLSVKNIPEDVEEADSTPNSNECLHIGSDKCLAGQAAPEKRQALVRTPRGYNKKCINTSGGKGNDRPLPAYVACNLIGPSAPVSDDPGSKKGDIYRIIPKA